MVYNSTGVKVRAPIENGRTGGYRRFLQDRMTSRELGRNLREPTTNSESYTCTIEDNSRYLANLGQSSAK